MPTSTAESTVFDPARSGIGSEGSLRLVVDRVAGRTRIVDLQCSGPVQALRCQYLDPAAPDIAWVTIASPSGGVLQGDRLRIDVEVRAGARLSLDTQSATRLYRMPDRPARIDARFEVGAGAWLEYVPHPYLPFAGSDTTIETEVMVDETSNIVFGEVVAAGRVARGEIFAMTSFRSTVTAVRPSGRLLFSDAATFDDVDRLGDPGMLAAGTVLGSLFVIGVGADDPDRLRTAASGVDAPAAWVGASSLPNSAGSWLRVVAADTTSASAVIAAAHDAARRAVVGTASPPSRRL